MQLLQVVLILSGATTGALALTLALVSVLNAVVDNVSLPSRPGLSRRAQARFGEAWKTWISLPLFAYVLAISTNIGSYLLLETDHHLVGAYVLFAGLPVLVLVGVLATRGAGDDDWDGLQDWSHLWAEVQEQQASPPPEAVWLARARAVEGKLLANPPRRQQLADEAQVVKGGVLLGSYKRPTLAIFGALDPNGLRVAVQWPAVRTWMWRRWWAKVTIAFAVLATLQFALLSGIRGDWQVAAVLCPFVGALPVLLVAVGERGNLIFNCRLHTEYVEVRAKTTAALAAM